MTAGAWTSWAPWTTVVCGAIKWYGEATKCGPAAIKCGPAAINCGSPATWTLVRWAYGQAPNGITFPEAQAAKATNNVATTNWKYFID